MNSRRFWVLFVAFALLRFTVNAHDLTLTRLEIRTSQQGLALTLRSPLSRFVQSLPAASRGDVTAMRREIARRILDGGTATRLSSQVLVVDSEQDMFEWSATLPGATDFQPKQAFYAEDSQSRTLVERIFPNGTRRLTTLSGSPPSFVTLGLGHILLGWDHLLFVLGLVLLSKSLAHGAKVLTAFTVAHSVTLFLCSANVLAISAKVVEPLIALSIVYLAFEILYGASGTEKNSRIPLAAFGFGLIHGCGFASGYRTLGFSGGTVLWSTLQFNIGVELGQLAVFSGLFVVIGYLGRFSASESIRKVIAVAIGMISTFWFFERLAGSW